MSIQAMDKLRRDEASAHAFFEMEEYSADGFGLKVRSSARPTEDFPVCSRLPIDADRVLAWDEGAGS